VHDLAALRAVFVRLPPGAALCRQSAAALHGFGEFAPLPPGVHVVLPRGAWRTRIKGLRTHEAVLPYELELVGGVPCTSLSRTAIDLARASRRLDALPVLDGALRAGATIDDLLARSPDTRGSMACARPVSCCLGRIPEPNAGRRASYG
jgi:hypothetical protein